MTKPQQADGLSMPEHVAGEDKTWDRLGKGWRAVDGAPPGRRIYVRWAEHEDGRTELVGLCVEGVPVTGEMLRSIPVGRLTRLARLAVTEPVDVAMLAPLVRRNVAPGEFAERVARHYRAFSRITGHPAKAIAEHSQVPVATVRGWIHEARMRGKLPPGTRGRAD